MNEDDKVYALTELGMKNAEEIIKKGEDANIMMVKCQACNLIMQSHKMIQRQLKN